MLLSSLTGETLDLRSLESHLSWIGCISHHEASKLLKYKPTLASSMIDKFLKVNGSIDLGYSSRELLIDNTGVGIDYNSDEEKVNHLITWDELEDVIKKKNACFTLYDDGSKPWQISTVSATSKRPASLCPPLNDATFTGSSSSRNAPTLLLGGFTMHRISGENVNPYVDTEAKLASISPTYFHGDSKILDTCMGLGYTCIGAARRIAAAGHSKSQGRVTTIEMDDASIEMCAYNPWSQQLFDGSLPIDILKGDACNIIKSFSSNSLDVVIHDPPARALCESDLYGLLFYSELFRVINKPKGCLFHYIGNPASKESGRLYKGVITRLQEAGFRDVQVSKEAFGVVAYT